MRLIRCLCGTLLAGGTLAAQQPGARLLPQAGRGTETIRRATVVVETEGAAGTRAGTGFIVSSNGLVATAAHLVRGATAARVRLTSGETYTVEGVAGIDERRDLALLRVAGFELPTVRLGNSDSVDVGSRLLAFGGAATGSDISTTAALLSRTGIDRGVRLFRLSLALPREHAGGPVATANGRVVGMLIAGTGAPMPDSSNAVLPINYVRGLIGPASTRAPTPLAEMTYQGSDTWAGGGAGRDSTTWFGRVPSRVNDSLSWRALDSVQLQTETSGDNGVRNSSLVNYRVTTTPGGVPVLERQQTYVRWLQADSAAGRAAATWYRDDSRTLLRLDGSKAVHMTWQRTSFRQEIPGGAFELDIADTNVVFDSGGVRRTGTVPRGTLPPELLGGAIAALPGRLPASTYVWVLSENSWPSRIEPVRIETDRSEQINVPSPRTWGGPGTCELFKAAPASRQFVEVVWITATQGATRLQRPVRATHPHVSLENTTCARIPN